MPERGLRGRVLYYALVPAIVIAVIVLGAVALRNSLQIEKAREQTVFDATVELADARVQRLDEHIVEQDNVAIAHVELSDLAGLSDNWKPTAARETPTIMAILIVDLDHETHDVLAHASRVPGPETQAFRRLLLARLIPEMDMADQEDELRHLHHAIGTQSYLVSYWQRRFRGRRYLVVAWHDVPRLVQDVMPRLYRGLESSKGPMNVVDERGAIVFGPPLEGGELTVGRPFPTTLYNWKLSVALRSAEDLVERVERQRRIELAMVSIAALVALTGLAIVLLASIRERRAALLKSDFVANVSHELKTPLALVRMFGEMLLDERVKNDDKRKQYLQIIVSESERLTALIENVLDFAKVERGSEAYDFEPGDIGEIVRRAVEIYRYRAEREGMRVDLAVAEEPLTAQVDARALELAVINLLDNATKYAKDGERIGVSVKRKAQNVLVEVADAGPGLSLEEQANVFQRFVRGKDAKAKQIRGSGIGLSLVQHIAESHGGSIDVRSPITDEGAGCCFTLRVPILEASESTRPGPPSPSEPPAEGREGGASESSAAV